MQGEGHQNPPELHNVLCVLVLVEPVVGEGTEEVQLDLGRENNMI